MSRPLFFLSLIFLGVMTSLSADTIELKNGTILEGNIITDGPDSVVIEYKVTPSIKDQKTVPKEDIVKMTSVSEDEKAFKDLGNLTPPPTALDTAFYDPLVDRKIPEFITAYRYSKHVSALREAAANLEKERNRIRQGDRKVEGVWITAVEIQKDPVETQARIRLADIKLRTASGDHVGALQSYELLEKNCTNSKVLPEAIGLALTNIGMLQQDLSVAQATFPALAQQTILRLGGNPANPADPVTLFVIQGSTNMPVASTNSSRVGADEIAAVKASIVRDVVAAKAEQKKVELDGSKFFPIYPSLKEMMDSLQKLAVAEKARLLDLRKKLTGGKP